MIALIRHEARMLTRRAMWPVALTLHAFAVSAFVGIWGPLGGVPLWEASTLHQLTAVERIVAAVLLTWLATSLLSDDDDNTRRVTDWSALTGRSVKAVFGARVVLSTLGAVVFMTVAAPAFAAAGASAAATLPDIAAEMGSAAGFSVFCGGVTAVSSVSLRDRVGVWCTAMAISLVAAAAVQQLDTTWLRMAVPAVAGVILLLLAPAGMNTQRQNRAA